MNKKIERTVKKALIIAMAAVTVSGAGVVGSVANTGFDGSAVVADAASETPLSSFRYEYLSNGKIKIEMFTGSETNIVIPSSVEEIAAEAFSYADPAIVRNIKSITIPNSVKKIGRGAFSGCEGLTSITIPGSVKTIDSLFVGCRNLKTVTFEDGVQSIGENVFYECDSLQKVTIPPSVTSINTETFEYAGKTSGKYTIYCKKGSKAESLINECLSHRVTGSRATKAYYVNAPQDNGSKLVDNQGKGGINTSTWVNWNNITAKANFKGEGGWKYKYSYKNDKDNKWVDLTGYVTSSSYRLPKFTKAGNYTIRIAATDQYGNYASKYTYLMVKQDSKKLLKDNGTKLSSTTVSKGQTITVSSKFTGGVVPYRYKYAYKKNNGSWVAIAQPKHDNTKGYSTDDNFSFKLPSQSGKYTVKVVCRDGVGKTSSKDITVTVK